MVVHKLDNYCKPIRMSNNEFYERKNFHYLISRINFKNFSYVIIKINYTLVTCLN